MATSQGEAAGDSASEGAGEGSAGGVLVRLVVSRHPYHREVVMGSRAENLIPYISLSASAQVGEEALCTAVRDALASGIGGFCVSGVTVEVIQKNTRAHLITHAWVLVKASAPFPLPQGFTFVSLEDAFAKVLGAAVPERWIGPFAKALRLVALARGAADPANAGAIVATTQQYFTPSPTSSDAIATPPSPTILTGVRPLKEDALSGAATAMRSPTSGGLRAKLDPPPGFNGADPRELPAWFASMNQYWAMLEHPPDELGKVLQATNALKGDAKSWWTHELVAAGGDVPVGTWGELQRALLEEYVDDDQNFDARQKLRAVRQVTSVERYIREWRARARYLRSASIDELVSCFLEGAARCTRASIEALRTP